MHLECHHLDASRCSKNQQPSLHVQKGTRREALGRPSGLDSQGQPIVERRTDLERLPRDLTAQAAAPPCLCTHTPHNIHNTDHTAKETWSMKLTSLNFNPQDFCAFECTDFVGVDAGGDNHDGRMCFLGSIQQRQHLFTQVSLHRCVYTHEGQSANTSARVTHA